MDVETIKSQFPFFQTNPSTTYLDNSATSQKPRAVINAISQFYENHNSNIHRGSYKSALQSTEMFDIAREIIAAHFGTEPNQLIFTKNATEGLNLAANSISHILDNKSEIVITILEHHSNFLPWVKLSEKTGANLKVATKLDHDMRLDISGLLQKITEKTKIIALTNASNVTGEIINIQKIVKRAKEVGALVVLDAAQSAPHLQIRFNSLGVDFLAFSGHKMLGPTGSGGVLVSNRAKNLMGEFMVGGGTISSVNLDRVRYAEFPERFEAGTPNIAGQIGLKEAVNFLQSLRMKSIELYEKNLTDYFFDRLKNLKGVKIFGPSNSINRLGVFSMKLDGISSEDAAIFLSEQNIAVRTGHHCAQPLINCFGEESLIRASLYLYNTKKDVDRLILALKKLTE